MSNILVNKYERPWGGPYKQEKGQAQIYENAPIQSNQLDAF